MLTWMNGRNLNLIPFLSPSPSVLLKNKYVKRQASKECSFDQKEPVVIKLADFGLARIADRQVKWATVSELQ